jgi:threonine/homoserine/homoserine lactone efflux protein
MNLMDTITLTAIMFLLAAIPSSSVALVVVRSATHNINHGIATILGIITGDLIFILLAILGLTTLSEIMGTLFAGVRYVAAAYLIWFGFGLIRNGLKNEIKTAKQRTGHYANSYLAGLTLTLGDVKAIVFYASLFPVFVDITSLQLMDVILIISITIITIGSVKFAYALTSQRIVNASRQLKYERPAKLTAGSLMVGLGGYLFAKT